MATVHDVSTCRRWCVTVCVCVCVCECVRTFVVNVWNYFGNIFVCSVSSINLIVCWTMLSTYVDQAFSVAVPMSGTVFLLTSLLRRQLTYLISPFFSLAPVLKSTVLLCVKFLWLFGQYNSSLILFLLLFLLLLFFVSLWSLCYWEWLVCLYKYSSVFVDLVEEQKYHRSPFFVRRCSVLSGMLTFCRITKIFIKSHYVFISRIIHCQFYKLLA